MRVLNVINFGHNWGLFAKMSRGRKLSFRKAAMDLCICSSSLQSDHQIWAMNSDWNECTVSLEQNSWLSPDLKLLLFICLEKDRIIKVACSTYYKVCVVVFLHWRSKCLFFFFPLFFWHYVDLLSRRITTFFLYSPTFVKLSLKGRGEKKSDEFHVHAHPFQLWLPYSTETLEGQKGLQ